MLPVKKEILNAFKTVSTEEFGSVLQSIENPYGKGGASLKIKDIIKNIDLTGILKTSIYDVTIG